MGAQRDKAKLADKYKGGKREVKHSRNGWYRFEDVVTTMTPERFAMSSQAKKIKKRNKKR